MFYSNNYGGYLANDHQWKLHHAMKPVNQRVGNFSLPVGAGTVSVTGVGFRPDVVVLITNLGSGAKPRQSYGCATSSDPSQQWAHAAQIGDFDQRFWFTEWLPGKIIAGCAEENDNGAGYAYVRASLQSLDSDGFTLNVTMQAHSSAINVAYLAMKGNFKAGVISVQESIAGLPFTPTGVLLMGNKRTGYTEVSRTVDWSCGFASKESLDPTQNQQSLWSGNRLDHFVAYGHWQTTSRYCPGYIANWGLAQNLDSPASLFTTYELWGKARVSSWGSNSIMLEWSDLKDATPYQFGYLAMDIPCETGRWDYAREVFEGKWAPLRDIYNPDWYPAACAPIDTLVDPVNAMLSMAPVAFGGSSGTYHTWELQYDTLGELARGYNASFAIGAVDPTLRRPVNETQQYGRWATSYTPYSWDGSVGPLRNNDPEPKNDEWWVAFAEAPGSSAVFVMETAGGLGKGASFPQASMSGSGSYLDPYGVSVGRICDLVHSSPATQKHLLPKLHVGP